MNYTRRRKINNNKKTRKHRGGINWKFWQTAPTAPAAAPAAAPAVVPTVPDNKCPPCPICAQKEEQAPSQMPLEMPPATQAVPPPPMESLMIGGRRKRSRSKKSSRSRKSSRSKKSKKFFQMGCKKLF